jgi:hypothetical protein
MKLLNHLIVIFILLFILMTSCKERKRDNPFDPGGDLESPISIELHPNSRLVKLTWSVENLTDFVGFRIYKSVNDSNQFELLQELSATQREYTDSTVQYYNWYYYRISVLGIHAESTPSPSKCTYLGPGNTCILSRYGYAIHEYSYDLKYRLNLYNTQYPPINWDWNLAEKQIWLANAQFRSISRLDISLGYVDFIYDEGLQRPIDICWNSDLVKLYILDEEKDKIFTLDGTTLSDTINLPGKNFLKMILVNNSRIITIDSTRAVIYASGTDSVSIINFSTGMIGQDIISEDNNIYILTSDVNTGTSVITNYSFITNEFQYTNCDGYFRILRKPLNQEYFWLGEQINVDTYRCVKLSQNGQRLLELSTFESIDDIQINPHDYSIIIAQRYQNKIILFNENGLKISENRNIYDPIKVFIY